MGLTDIGERGAGDDESVRAAVADASAVLPTGAGTHRDVGNPVDADAIVVRAPRGIVSYDPAELTATVRAGTPIRELADALAEAGQECPLDPRDDRATVGGVIAAGLTGHRRLRYGPLRDKLLEVRFVTGDARIVRGGGPTVKNVTGYDLPRLLVGSLGTLGVLTRVILRCQPRPMSAQWFEGGDPADVRRACFRPSTIFWGGGTRCSVLLEGHPGDVEAQRAAAGLEVTDVRPPWPDAPHRGRVSIEPRRVRELGDALAALGPGVEWLAEWSVGTVHVGARTERDLASAREAAMTTGGWLLRESGAPGLDGFGCALPNAELMSRVKQAFDPAGKLAPGRLPLHRPPVEPEVVRR